MNSIVVDKFKGEKFLHENNFMKPENYNEHVKEILSNNNLKFSDKLFILYKSKKEDSEQISELIHYNFDNAPTYNILREKEKNNYKECNTPEKICSKISKTSKYPINISIKDNNGKIIGFLSAKKEGIHNNGLMIKRWHINPNNAGNSLGKLLIDKATTLGKNLGYKYIKIAPSNDTAKKILEKYGFSDSNEIWNKSPTQLPILIKNL